ncbi:DUF6461 domain-containing protein [Streptomyces sp. NPDC002132]|uniref:DUF6461 domain-containing protein n=1 Tax=unclassified Streptomyces TaxID=2593676 RepID=UPI0033339D22
MPDPECKKTLQVRGRLAERLTGLRVTESLLQDATYELGLVLEQPAEEWTGLVIDITDAKTTESVCTRRSRRLPTAHGRRRTPPVVITYNEPLAKDRSEDG